jgi:UDP-N-acetylmuramoylalanine--D-glutamate ligase
MVELRDYTGQTLAVMGLGKSGMATLAALKNSGARVLVWDDNEAGRDAATKAGFEITDLAKADWTKINSLILSPGIPHTYPEPHPVAALAKKHGVEIIGDVELLFRHFKNNAPRMVGITGTNGKSTTTALIAHILKSAGRNVEVGGNLGIPVLSFSQMAPDGFLVIEMSSFQAELTPSAAFDVTVWLNITPDHIDRHGDMQGYVNAKKKLLRDAGKKQVFICGVDDDYSRHVANEAIRGNHWQVTEISSQKILPNGLSGVNGDLYKDGEKLFTIKDAKTLPGAHNAQNIAAAFAACHALGVDTTSIEQAIFTYPGLPHRQQLVRTITGIRFINDSKATNADAASKALSCYDNIYWIAGGKPKDGGLNGLEEFMPRIRHAFLIGQASDDFASWLNGKTPATKSGTLEVAIKQAAALAAKEGKKDAVVLLSPACASYDQFKSYEHRGDEFVKFVAALPDNLSKVAA